MQDVLKREVVEGEKAQEAKNKIKRAASRALRAKTPKEAKQEATQIEAISDNSREEEKLAASQCRAVDMGNKSVGRHGLHILPFQPP